MVNAIFERDYNAAQGSIIVYALIFSIVMLLMDVLYAFSDPRIKAQFVAKSVSLNKEKGE